MATHAGDMLRRVPPQNIEAEESVLGAILLDNDSIDRATEVLEVDDFYRESHRQIFDAMLRLRLRAEPIDAVLLTDELRAHGMLEQVGGPAYIGELAMRVPTAANLVHYARIVREKAALRRLATAATEIASEAYDNPPEIEAFIDEAERKLFRISELHMGSKFHSMLELTKEAIRQVERLYEKKELVTGISTGFTDLDRITAGFQPADLIVIAARPSMGKTALALNIAANVAKVPKTGVAFFSLEMSKEQLALRMLCSEARVDMAKVRSGFLSESDFPKLAQAARHLSEMSIFIDDSSDITPMRLAAHCRRLAKDCELGLIVVDYLQLMRPAKAGESREREIAEISRSLKALAKELKIPVLALSQLNRQVETRADRRPLLADLRESGAIEQDADVIGFIYRDDVYHKDSKVTGTAELILAKQRNGPIDTVILTFIRQFTRFEDFMIDSREEY